MTKRRLLLAGIVLIAAAGCGVRPTGVIPGVAAPSGPAEGVALYFLQNKSVTLVLRPTGQDLSPTDTLTLLRDGPDTQEQAQGFTSAVPPDAMPVGVGKNEAGQVIVTLSTDVAALSTVAVDQIVCTTRDALATQAPVVLAGRGRAQDPRVCSISGGHGIDNALPGTIPLGRSPAPPTPGRTITGSPSASRR